MAKHFCIECTEDDKITAVIRFEAPKNDGDSIEAKLTIDCPPDAVPDLALSLRVALLAIETYSEQAASLPGRLN